MEVDLSIMIVIIIVLAVIVVAMVTAFLFLIISIIRQIRNTNDQLLFSNMEWADKYRDTIKSYENEIQDLLEDFYGNEEELKN